MPTILDLIKISCIFDPANVVQPQAGECLHFQKLSAHRRFVLHVA